jgi:NAD(P)-dependent dehydrogenase (short-subunit alcohol dehydrogenase family)
MPGRLENKITIVTGGGSGVGRATAQLFHTEGAYVAVADITGAQDETVAGLGERALAVQADVSRADEVANMIDVVLTTFGGLDVMFNNAGIDGELSPLEDCTEQNFDRVLAVNLKGVFLGMKFAIPPMRTRGRGSIVNTASVAGLVGMPTLSAFGASKGGVLQLTRVAAAECAASGIRVNAICPGVLDTPPVRAIAKVHPEVLEQASQMTPLGRLGQASEIAQMALFLASDDSSFVTGAAMVADGGFTAC